MVVMFDYVTLHIMFCEYRLGGWYSYRMSKAALNMFTKTLGNEVKR